jgi:hypothetical protein
LKKLEGVLAENPEKDILITAGEKPGTQKVTFKATKEITKEKAIEAMGDKKDTYVVQSLKKAEEEKAD